ncbi:MAG: endonuclease/exonuclease/phosphatase family protein [Rhabdochlamydiaceae bacterium]
MQWKFDALRVASWCNTPVCAVRENIYRLYILNETSHTTAQKLQQVVYLTLGIVVYAVLTPFTAPLGAAIRGVISTYEKNPYVYFATAADGKKLPADKQLSVVSYNLCLMPGGYSITDGQVTPPSDRARVDENIEKLKKLNSDIICLFEVEDACDAAYLSKHLSDYPFIIPVAGVRAIGPSSMMYIASKYKIDPNSITFVPFAKDSELTGRARWSEKGMLSFDLQSENENQPYAHMIISHLQHSEIPSKPELNSSIPGVLSEVEARSIQTGKILKQIQTKVNKGYPVIFTGDLNQGEEELKSALSEYPSLNLQRDAKVQGKSTWGGDTWCATLMNKTSSPPQVLDYTFVAGADTSISTHIIETGYEGSTFKTGALSDHCILHSTISLGSPS